jgi:hypothetical protein
LFAGDISAQNMPKAYYVILDVVENLQKQQSTSNSSALINNASATLNSLKEVVGGSIISNMKNGDTATVALGKAVTPFRSNDASRNALTTEVETFYSELIRKSN